LCSLLKVFDEVLAFRLAIALVRTLAQKIPGMDFPGNRGLQGSAAGHSRRRRALFRRTSRARPLVPRRITLEGSGVMTPGTFTFGVVPNEKVAELMIVSALMPDPEIVKVAD
jgi:hypothetical protein